MPLTGVPNLRFHLQCQCILNEFMLISPLISITVAWSVEYLSSNPAARVRFPAVRGIFLPNLELGAKGDWDFRSYDLVKTLMELIFNPCGEFR